LYQAFDDLGRRDSPNGLRNSIESDEIERGRTFLHSRDDCVDFRATTVSEKYKPGTRAKRSDQPSPVVFLVLPRALVLLDDVTRVRNVRAFVDVVVDVTHRGETGLHMDAHSLPVKINGGGCFADQCTGLLQRIEVLAGSLVDECGV